MSDTTAIRFLVIAPDPSLEEEFDISIPDEDAEKIRTVGEAISYIENKQGS